VAKKFIPYLPTQHARRGIITPFDVSFHPNIIDTFLNENAASFTRKMISPEYFGSIINPLKALMTATTVMLEIF
jgi:hypothetical protein